MKKTKYFLVGLLLFLFATNVHAMSYELITDLGFNYGGDKTDEFYDIDFFSDGSYVVVGETYSSYRGIVNKGDNRYPDGLAVIFDKNNNIVKEFNWYGDSENTVESFYSVKVIDDNSFVVLASSSTSTAYCIKYQKDGTEVWKTQLRTTGHSYYHSYIYKESDGNLLISYDGIVKIGLVRLNGNNGEVLDTMQLATDYSMDKQNAIAEFKNNYYSVGSGSTSGSTTAYKISKTGEILKSKTYFVSTLSEIFDVDVLDNNLLFSFDIGTCQEEDCQALFGDTGLKDSGLAIVDENLNIIKSVALDTAGTHNIETTIMGDKIISYVMTPDHTDVYIYDKDLNKIAKFKYPESGKFLVTSSAVNPLNNKLYLAGISSIEYGDIKNSGGHDGFVMTFDYRAFDDEEATAIITPTNPSTTGEVKEEVKEEVKVSENREEKATKNPETGAFLSLSFFVVLASIFAVVVLYKNSKKKFFRL